MALPNIKELSTAEKLQTLESVWSSFEAEAISVTSPDWHEDILKSRKTSLKEDIKKGITLEQLRTQGYRK